MLCKLEKFKTLLKSFIYANSCEFNNAKFETFCRKNRKFSNVIAIFFISYFFFSLTIVFFTAKIIFFSTKSFIINSRTEQFEYIPANIDPPRISLQDAELYIEHDNQKEFDPSEEVNLTFTKIKNGSIQISKNSKITFSRIGSGPLQIRVENTEKNDQKYALYDKNEEIESYINNNFSIKINNTDQLISNGKRWQYNIHGNITIGKIPPINTINVNGLLLDGEIQMVAKKVINSSLYTLDPVKLHLGDEVSFSSEEKSGNAFGLVTLDEGKGMLITSVIQSDTATIKKVSDINIKIKNSLWDVLQKDYLLTLGWAFIFFFPGLLTILFRWFSFNVFK